MARIRGGFGNDNLVGNGDDEGDSIQGFSGNDTLTGDDTDDTLDGGPGNDILNGRGGDDRLDAGYGTDSLNGGAGNDLLGFGGDLLDGEQDTVDGGPGRDRIDYTDVLYFAVHVDLSTGLATDTDGTETVLYDIVRNIEDIVGGDLDDTLTGDAGDNHIRGDVGADTLDGRGGRDTASYYGSRAAVHVNLGGTTDTDGYVTATSGDAAGDRLRNFENLVGSSHNDTLGGDDRNNTFRGGAGADILDGRGGRDWADYTGSDAAVTVNLGATKDSDGFVAASGGHATGDKLKNMEHLIGSEHGDVLTGDGGNNTLRGAAGADTLDGGNGRDRLDYRDSDAGVTVNLATDTASGGHAQGDVISNFENIRGSDHDDVLTGNGSKNVFVVGAGDDTIDGGGGNKNVVNYRLSDAAVWVDLATTRKVSAGVYETNTDRVDADGFITVRGPGGGDKLKNINGIIGSAFDDVLKGNRGSGAEANDYFRGGAGADKIYGRGGRDRVDYRDSKEGVTVSLVDGTVNSGGTAEGDILYSIENIRGSRHADTLVGNGKNNYIRGEGGVDTLTGGGDGSDYDYFVFKEDWADGTVITDYTVLYDSIISHGLNLDDVTIAAHDRDGDDVDESTTLTLNGNVLLLQGVDYDAFISYAAGDDNDGAWNFIT
ncbi:MAG: hypothetical protein GDA52_09145 [Rhodobacteraceae bacterium]|nr:hypothetical protein [Paracoccaceae bacterium]